MHNIN